MSGLFSLRFLHRILVAFWNVLAAILRSSGQPAWVISGIVFSMIFCSILDMEAAGSRERLVWASQVVCFVRFYLEMLLWLEDCSLNRAPMPGGDRFFNAISSASISDRFSDRSRLRSKKGIEKGIEEASKLEHSSMLGYDWGDEARGQ